MNTDKMGTLIAALKKATTRYHLVVQIADEPLSESGAITRVVVLTSEVMPEDACKAISGMIGEILHHGLHSQIDTTFKQVSPWPEYGKKPDGQARQPA